MSSVSVSSKPTNYVTNELDLIIFTEDDIRKSSMWVVSYDVITILRW